MTKKRRSNEANYPVDTPDENRERYLEMLAKEGNDQPKGN